MRLRAVLALTILCLPIVGMAQSRERSEVPARGTVYGGYSLLHANNDLTNFTSDFTNSSNNFNGWEGQGTFNFTRHLGVTADFTGNSSQLAGVSLLGFSAGARQHIYQYLFGPTVSTNFGKSSLFAHALFGGAHSSLGAGVGLPLVGGFSAPIASGNAFAMAFGGGIVLGSRATSPSGPRKLISCGLISTPLPPWPPALAPAPAAARTAFAIPVDWFGDFEN